MATDHDEERGRHLRKRKHVDYCEVDEAISLEDDEDDDFGATRKKQRTKASRREKAFPFLSLPAEIRNRIYELMVGERRDTEWIVSKVRRHRKTVRCATDYEYHNHFRFRCNHWGGVYKEYADERDSDSGDEPDRGRAPNMLAVCRQIFEEFGPIMYPRTFVFETATALHHFLADTGPCKRAFVDKVVIKGWDDGRAHKAYIHPALSLLTGLPGLKEVEFDCELSTDFRHDEQKVMQACARAIFRHGFRWLEVVNGSVAKVKLGENALGPLSGKEEHLPAFYEELKRLVNSSRQAYGSRALE